MASKISFECPACSSKLSVSDSSKLGKKIKCPKCKEVFLPEIPGDDDIDGLEDDFVDEPKEPSSKKRVASGGKGSKKGNSSGGGSSLPLIIGGVVAVLVLVGAGVAFWVFSNKPLPASADSNPAPVTATPAPAIQTSTPAPDALKLTVAEKILGLRWMPAETDFLVHAKLAEIWDAPLLKGPLGDPSVTAGLQVFQKQVGMLPSEIESVSIGIIDLAGSVIKTMAASTPSGGPSFGGSPFPNVRPEDVRYVLVVKTKKPVDLKLIAQSAPNAKLQEKNGKPYFDVAANPPMTPATGGWSPEPHTLILATSRELYAVMERGETAVPRKEFASIDHLPQLVIAGVVPSPKEEGKQSSDAAEKPIPDAISGMLKANDQYKLRLAYVGLTVKGGFDLQISALGSTPDDAKRLKTDVESQLGNARSMFDVYKLQAPPLIADLGEMLLTNLKIEEQNRVVKLSTGVPDSAQSMLEQLPPVVMLMAMTGGFGGGAGGPLGAPPNFGASPGSMPTKVETEGIVAIKMPGETAAIDATTVEGLPEAMTLTARTAWSLVPAVAADGKPTSTIEILIDATGGGLETICAATGVSPKTVMLDGGGTLKKSKRIIPGGIDAQKTFLPFDVENVVPLEHPPQTLRVRLAVDAPTNDATKIDVLEGSFKYLTAAKSDPLTIENAPQKWKRPLSDPEFKAGGVKWLRSTSGTVPETLKLECGKGHSLGLVRGTPGGVTSLTEVEKGTTIQRIYSNHTDGKFPEDFEIKFKLHTDVKEQTVTFRFENIPLPTPESKPELQPQQQQTQSQ